MNTASQHKIFTSKELNICPSSGQLSSTSKSVRLGPVNMRVLVVLLQHAGQVVSRELIFESVWSKQIVSDDTLTRCISDLRSQLKTFDSENTIKYIETVPKRGYRWLYEASIKQEPNKIEPITTSNLTKSSVTDERTSPLVNQDQAVHQIKSLLVLVFSSIAIFALLSYLLLWSVNYFNDSSVIKVALLPVKIDLSRAVVGKHTAASDLKPLARNFEDLLKQQILSTENIRFLSNKTLEGAHKNLYPYLSREFSARWIIETRIRTVNNGAQIIVNIVDARTAIVSDSISIEVNKNGQEIEKFIDSLLILL